MSIKAVKWALAIKGIDATNKLALIAIAESHNDKSGDCYPSQRYIAEVIGLTERPTRARLNQLEADGFYTRNPRYDTRGKRTSDGYVLHFDRAEALPAEATAASDELVLTAEAATGSKTKSENSLPAVSELLPADTAAGTNICTGRVVPEELFPGDCNISEVVSLSEGPLDPPPGDPDDDRLEALLAGDADQRLDWSTPTLTPMAYTDALRRLWLEHVPAEEREQVAA
jgi:hypothetical protein